MTNSEQVLLAEDLCKQCGLCCSTFHSIGIVSNESEKILVKSFGGEVSLSMEGQLTFKQPCPGFNGICSVHPHHPQSCKSYQCNLLNSFLDRKITLNYALEIVAQTKVSVNYIDTELLPLLGKRAEIMEEYFEHFLNKKENMKYEKILMQFGIYRFLRVTYFDHNESN